jgi:hypothetical protein
MSDSRLEPEILAELRFQSGLALTGETVLMHPQPLETAIALYTETLRVYTPGCYPLQHAKVQIALGNIYQQRIAGNRQDNLRLAIRCYDAALLA